jgi:hypothetical protein
MFKKIIFLILILLFMTPRRPLSVETFESLQEKKKQATARIKPPFGEPVLLTSFGQGPGASIVSAYIDGKTRIEHTFLPLAQPADLQQYETVLVEVGLNLRGLKIAETNLSQEKKRTTALLRAARENNIPVVLIHTGGLKQRGENVDPMLELAAPLADYLLVKKGGNEDGFLAELASEHGVALHVYDGYTNLPRSISKIISRWGESTHRIGIGAEVSSED